MTIDPATAGFLAAVLIQTAGLVKLLVDTNGLKKDQKSILTSVHTLETRVAVIETVLSISAIKVGK